MPALALQQQSWVVKAEIIQPAKPNIFIEYLTLYRKSLPTPALKISSSGAPCLNYFKLVDLWGIPVPADRLTYSDLRWLLMKRFSWCCGPASDCSSGSFSPLPAPLWRAFICPLQFCFGISSPTFFHPPGINCSLMMLHESAFSTLILACIPSRCFQFPGSLKLSITEAEFIIASPKLTHAPAFPTFCYW